MEVSTKEQSPGLGNSLLKEHELVLRRIKQEADKLEKSPAQEKDMAGDFIHHFFLSAFPQPDDLPLPLQKDIHHLKTGIAAIMGLRDENVLNEQEANAVLEFLVSRFIGRRFDRITRQLLPTSSESTKWFYRATRS